MNWIAVYSWEEEENKFQRLNLTDVILESTKIHIPIP